MLNIDRILFPVDLSGQSRRVAPFVKAMASRFQAEIVMLYVQKLLVPAYAPPEAITYAAITNAEEVRKQCQQEFQTFLNSDFSGMSVQKILSDGDVADEIVCHAKKDRRIGLIMMPTHGYGRFRRFLLGSVTAKVLHDTDRPVWTDVHAPEGGSSAPESCRRILCAIDTETRSTRVLQWASEFAMKMQAELQIVHAVEGLTDQDATRDVVFHEFIFKGAREAIEKLQETAGTGLPVVIRPGKPEHVIHNVAEDLKADLIVIGRGDINEPLGRLRTHAYAIIRESPCPVISV
jgi:nucleotide-binding universal stress UspA family protein